ncbi:hypothetical protein [Nocardia nepalensis]|uniref:hypothetical protein n=1 Tax=Nocardia nepalensis TaxID=3375448 RepID=UPI003B66F4C3
MRVSGAGVGGSAAAWLEFVRDLIGILGHASRLLDIRAHARIVRALLDVTAGDRPAGLLLAEDGVLAQALARDGALDRLLASDGLLARLGADDGILERVMAEGGTLDQIESLSSTIAAVRPVLHDLGPSVLAIADSAARITEVASPIGDLAGWFPAKRRRSRADDIDTPSAVPHGDEPPLTGRQ